MALPTIGRRLWVIGRLAGCNRAIVAMRACSVYVIVIDGGAGPHRGRKVAILADVIGGNMCCRFAIGGRAVVARVAIAGNAGVVDGCANPRRR